MKILAYRCGMPKVDWGPKKMGNRLIMDLAGKNLFIGPIYDKNVIPTFLRRFTMHDFMKLQFGS